MIPKIIFKTIAIMLIYLFIKFYNLNNFNLNYLLFILIFIR